MIDGEGDGGEGHVEDGGSDGDNPASWRDSYTGYVEADDEREVLSNYARRFNSEADYHRGVANMVRMQGSMVRIPGEDAKPEDVDAFYRKLGKPDKVDGYKDAFVHDPKRGDLDESEKAAQESFAELSHRINLTTKQVQEIIKWEDHLAISTREAQVQHFQSAEVQFTDDAVKELKKRWGDQDYDANINYANSAWKTYAGDKAEELGNIRLANGGKLSDIPDLVDIFARVGRERSTDQRGLQGYDEGAADDVKAQIAAIREEARLAGKSSSEEPYHSRLDKLYKRLSGSAPIRPGVARFGAR